MFSPTFEPLSHDCLLLAGMTQGHTPQLPGGGGGGGGGGQTPTPSTSTPLMTSLHTLIKATRQAGKVPTGARLQSSVWSEAEARACASQVGFGHRVETT